MSATADQKIRTAADILEAMAATFRERNKVYGDNFIRVGDMMAALFPNGVELQTPDDFVRFHLLELSVVKLTRFAVSGLTHIDSIHDSAVYDAMLESVITPDTLPVMPIKRGK
jgi:hypothetical protein